MQTMHHLHDFYLSRCYRCFSVHITLNCTNIPCISSFTLTFYLSQQFTAHVVKAVFFCFKSILCQVNLGITASALVILLAES